MIRRGFAVPGVLEVIFPPMYRGRGYIGLIAAYVDRSTLESAGARLFTVAGLLAPSEQWVDRFAPAWEAILERECLPYFHMSDYENRACPPYTGWTNEHRVDVFQQFCAVLGSVDAIGGAVTLDLTAYGRRTKEERDWLGSPYKFCGMLLIRQFAHLLARHNVVEPVAYVFEAGDTGSGALKRAIDSLGSAQRRALRVHSLVYAEKDEFCQLQVADIAAYEAGKSAIRDGGWDSRPHRQSLFAFLKETPEQGYFFDESTLDRWLTARMDPLTYGVDEDDRQ